MNAHYQTLGVPVGSNIDTVRRAYRSLALRWHPDKHPDPEARAGAAEQFLDVQAAYEALSGTDGRGTQPCLLSRKVNAKWKAELDERRREREEKQRSWTLEMEKLEARLAEEEADRRRQISELDDAFDARLAAARRERSQARRLSAARGGSATSDPVSHFPSEAPANSSSSSAARASAKADDEGTVHENAPKTTDGDDALSLRRKEEQLKFEARRHRCQEDRRRFMNALQQIEEFTSKWPASAPEREVVRHLAAEQPAAVC